MGVDIQNVDATAFQRPIVITILCVVIIGGALAGIPALFLHVHWKIGAFGPPLFVASILIGLVCAFGLWRMWRWAAITYSVFAVINQVILIATGSWTMFAIAPLVGAAVMLFYLKKMR